MPPTFPRQLVIFRVAETHYGFDIDAVEEILAPQHITALPGAPNGVLGLADVRGKVIPVFDLHWKFGVSGEDGSNSRFVIVRTYEGSVALLVDAVDEVVLSAENGFQPVSAPGRSDGLGYLNGVFRHGDAFVLWVDPVRLVPAGVAQGAKLAA